jgi:hypothetical protein
VTRARYGPTLRDFRAQGNSKKTFQKRIQIRGERLLVAMDEGWRVTDCALSPYNARLPRCTGQRHYWKVTDCFPPARVR